MALGLGNSPQEVMVSPSFYIESHVKAWTCKLSYLEQRFVLVGRWDNFFRGALPQGAIGISPIILFGFDYKKWTFLRS